MHNGYYVLLAKCIHGDQLDRSNNYDLKNHFFVIWNIRFYIFFVRIYKRTVCLITKQPDYIPYNQKRMEIRLEKSTEQKQKARALFSFPPTTPVNLRHCDEFGVFFFFSFFFPRLNQAPRTRQQRDLPKVGHHLSHTIAFAFPFLSLPFSSRYNLRGWKFSLHLSPWPTYDNRRSKVRNPSENRPILSNRKKGEGRRRETLGLCDGI